MRLVSLFVLFVLHLSSITSQDLMDSQASSSAILTDSIDANAPALTKVTVQARVGVLLDEIPISERSDLISLLQTKDNAWWRQRAQQQIDLTSYRLTYRTYYYNQVKYQLVLPGHDQWSFLWDDDPPVVETRQQHKLFTRGYTMTTYILSTHESIKKSEQSLKTIGGSWIESFTLPIDPTLLLQRTGFACLDEAQYPPGVADPEKISFLFDDTCDMETSIVINDLGCAQCHCTLPLPTQSCKVALRTGIGSLNVDFLFTRVAYDSSIAAQYRAPSANVNGADLSPSDADLQGTRVLYRYFPSGSCERAIDEMCIGGFGWRRLLYFDAVDRNVGTVDLDMETTDFVNAGIAQTPPAQEIAHGLYEYSSCHHHYHFRHFGNFSFQTGSQVPTSSKRGFCIASVDRWANAEWAPTWSDFSTCETQGITRGWSDTYQAGISCQWIDITNVGSGTNVGTLVSKTNPDGLLCEGTLQKYPNGSQIYEPTSFTTLSGQPVSKQSCNVIPNYAANNQVSASVIIPNTGASYVTEPCLESMQHFGPLRNCEFDGVTPLVRTCSPGQQTSLTCTFNSTDDYQVLRVCEASRALNTGTACRHQDGLRNLLIQSGPIGTTFNFQCPSAKSGDSIEIGGVYSLYTAQLWGDNPSSVSCN